MSYDVYKASILRVLPASPKVLLEAAPVESFDMQDTQVCPNCGCADALIQQIEETELARCPKCQCEFAPRVESVSRKVIRRVREHRQRRLQRVMERLPRELPGTDPTDYALFRKIVDGPETDPRKT